MKIFFVSTLLFLLIPITVTGTNETSASFTWTANTETNLAGYKIYYGGGHRDYHTHIVIPPDETTGTVSGLIEGNKYYFAATAFDTDGLESDYSTEVVWKAVIKSKAAGIGLTVYHGKKYLHSLGHNLMKKLFILFFLLFTQFCCWPVAWAATYYVSADGDDTNNGTSTSTTWAHHPYDLNATDTADSVTLLPNDIIYMKRGDVWHDVQFTVNQSGDVTGNIITDAYGTGDNPKLYSSWDQTGFTWAHEGSNVYSTAGVSVTTYNVYYNDEYLTENDGATTSVSLGEWDQAGSTLYVNVGDSPDSGELLVSKRSYAALFQNAGDYNTFQNVGFYMTNTTDQAPILCITTDNLVFDGVEVAYSGNVAGTGVFKLSGCNSNIIRSSTFRTGQDVGLFITNSDNNTFESNEIYDMHDGVYYPTGRGPGVYNHGSSENNTYNGNYIHDCYVGINETPSSGAGGSLYINNILSDIVVNSIQVYRSVTTPAEFYHNTVFSSPSQYNSPAYSGHAFTSKTYVTHVIAANNLFMTYLPTASSLAAGCSTFNINLDSTVDVRVDNNQVWNLDAYCYEYHLASNLYDNITDWTTATQTEATVGDLSGTSGNAGANGFNSDPVVNSFGSALYSLGGSSTSINAGSYISGYHDQATAVTDYNGLSILTVPDIGAIESGNTLHFNADYSGTENGTKGQPYSAWTDYTWTGYNIRSGSTIYFQGDMGALDLSGLTDTAAVTIETQQGKSGSVSGFVTNTDSVVNTGGTTSTIFMRR